MSKFIEAKPFGDAYEEMAFYVIQRFGSYPDLPQGWSNPKLLSIQYEVDVERLDGPSTETCDEAVIALEGPDGRIYRGATEIDVDAHRSNSEGLFYQERSPRTPANSNTQPVYLREIQDAFINKTDSPLERLVRLNHLPRFSSQEVYTELPPYAVIFGDKPEELYFLITRDAKHIDDALQVNGGAVLLDLEGFTSESWETECGDYDVGELWYYPLEKIELEPRKISHGTPLVPLESSLAKILDEFLRRLPKPGSEAEYYDNFNWASADFIADYLRIPLK